MSNRYLNEIGYDPYWENPEEDSPKLQKEREFYGFDQRETWNLDETFAAWAYSHLRRLMDASGDFINWGDERYLVDIPSVDERWRIDYIFTEKVTLKKAIEIMLEHFEFYLQNKCIIETEDLASKHLSYAASIWGIVLTSLWW